MKMAESVFFYIFWFAWMFCFISLLSVEFIPNFVMHLYSSYFGLIFSDDAYGSLIATLLWSSLTLTIAIMMLIYLFFKDRDSNQF
ncbi:Uncharacterised protein [Yersinia massiliensis]|uniref:hypothetical protein n=1 Tax=Yersinia massiliensis TaxID=419257 RepID=UPI0005DED708|nr:hypothetical protein [Yersinia massiliensis]CNI14683.1 Uncharacterised protein [Yersinia massiliensis]